MQIKLKYGSVRYLSMLLAALLVVGLAGCTVFSNFYSDSYIESGSPPGLGDIVKPAISGTSIAESVPTCTSDAACQRGWIAARKWVLQHCAPNKLLVDSKWEIRSATASDRSGQLHCEVKRKSGPYGSTFYVQLSHASSLLNRKYHNNLQRLMLDFNHTVNRAIRSG